nr:sulfatase-like hydrolase/transferase [Saprospiraceae bacterium]
YCSPSRAGLLAGRYQQKFGHENNTPYNQQDENAGLPLDEQMLSEVLKENGYNTCAIGKWHLGDHEKFWPINRGFDEWFGFYGGGMSFWGDIGKKPAISGVLRNGEIVPQSELTYLTDDFSAEAVKFIQKQEEDPFFLYLAYNAPHAPIHATEEYLAKTDHIEDGGRSAYAAMVVGMDEGIGKVIQTLKEQGLYENTLIFFYSDNGGHLHGASSYPFRGHKGMLFEGGIRVPFLLSYPDKLKYTHHYPHAISALDIFPTVLAAADITPTKPLDGVNLLPFISGNASSPPHHKLFWRYSDGAGYAVRKDNYKLIYSGYKEDVLLFNLDTDPFEKNNLAQEQPEKVKELLEEYQVWNKELIPAKWYDPHPENILKEEQKRQSIRNKAKAGEVKKRKP